MHGLGHPARSLRDGVPQRALITFGGKRRPAKPDLGAGTRWQYNDALAQRARCLCLPHATVPSASSSVLAWGDSFFTVGPTRGVALAADGRLFSLDGGAPQS